MDLEPSDEQTWLAESVETLLAREWTPAADVPSGTVADRGKLWRSLVDFGALTVGGEEGLGAVELCLIVRPGMKQEDVSVVYSKPIALNQCRKFLEQHYPKARQASLMSTTAAVQKIMDEPGAAAIGAERAAAQYGAEVLTRGVQDSVHNKTRFVVLSEVDCEVTGRDKTSIAFAVSHDRAGTLVEVLHEFSDRSINLTTIESRPSREELGVYIFLIDMDGHRTDRLVAEALAAVENKASFYRALGSYPRYDDA